MGSAAVQDRSLTGSDLALETVTGENIRDDSVRSPDILDGTVASIDIRDGGVDSVDLAPGSVTSEKIADGAVQPQDMGFTVGDITAVTVAGGLSGGGTSGAVVLAVGAGNGIQVSGSSVGLAPSYFSGSAYDGRFVSQSLPTWLPQTAALSVSGTAFRQARPLGKYTVEPTQGYLYVDSAANSGAEDRFTAPVQLPHGAQITGFTVTYWDNSPGLMEVSLYRARQTTGSVTKIASVTTEGQSTGWKTGSDPTITETGVDNAEFTYWLLADFPPDPQGDNLRVLSVRIPYTVAKPH